MRLARTCFAPCAVAIALLWTGCGDDQGGAPTAVAGQQSRPASERTDETARQADTGATGEAPATKGAGSGAHPCVRAREAIGTGSDLFTRLGDPRGASPEELVRRMRDALAEWADGIRAEGERAEDPLLAEGLTEMADGIDAATRRIRGPDGLQQAGRFLESDELVVANEKIINVCAEHLPAVRVPGEDG